MISLCLNCPSVKWEAMPLHYVIGVLCGSQILQYWQQDRNVGYLDDVLDYTVHIGPVCIASLPGLGLLLRN